MLLTRIATTYCLCIVRFSCHSIPLLCIFCTAMKYLSNNIIVLHFPLVAVTALGNNEPFGRKGKKGVVLINYNWAENKLEKQQLSIQYIAIPTKKSYDISLQKNGKTPVHWMLWLAANLVRLDICFCQYRFTLHKYLLHMKRFLLQCCNTIINPSTLT